jgi:hypothetical protein
VPRESEGDSDGGLHAVSLRHQFRPLSNGPTPQCVRTCLLPEHHRETHDVVALADVVRREGVAQMVPAETREPELSLE